MAYADGEREGVGGWLVFFLVTLGLFTPLFAIGTALALSELAAAAFDPEPFQGAIAWKWGFVAVRCALVWFAVGRFLFIRNWTTVQIGVISLWVLAAYALAIDPVIVSPLTDLATGDLVAAPGLASFIQPIGYAAIWTAYLLNSERVANTYRPRSDDDGLAEPFE